ncbi:MAG: heparan-alpha-glucosaminide N-acetyltransferase [Candidatus Peregrinibacteria bacterium]
MPSHKRFSEIDIWRGTALVGMIIFHFFFILNYFNIFASAMREGGWLVLARFVQFSFLFLVGISLALAGRSYKKQFKRALMVFGLGMIISLVTFIFAPDEYVKFGMLHLIGVSIFVLSFMADKKYLPLMFGIGIFVISFFISKIPTSSIILFAVGLKGDSIASLDYFPVFPWMGIAAFGVSFGNIYKNFRSKFDFQPKKTNPLNSLSFLGRHTLLIYMAQIPAMILVMIMFGIIPLNALFS